MKTYKAISILVFFLLIVSCSCEKKDANNSFIKTPFPHLNIPFEDLTVNANNGGDFLFKTGSSIYFPPNAFIDKDGNEIKGDVKIEYREFSSPLDFFLAGIPMNYDTLNTSYSFESAGMLEINASKDNEQVFVNPKNKPVMSLISSSNDINHNLYYLDTIQKKWFVKGKSKIESKISEGKPIYQPISENTISFPPEPIKPILANNERPIISVDIPYVDYVPELKIFKNTKFEIDESEKNYNPKEADYEWDKVSLKETDTRGLYLIVFSTKKRTVSYKVRPVYENADYNEALKTFIEQQNLRKQQVEKLKIEEEKREKQYEIELKNWEADQKKERGIKRIFELERFGLWNCDKIYKVKTIELTANFVDKNSNKVNLETVYLANKDLNGLFTFNSNKIKITPQSPHALWGIYNGKLYYFSYKEFEDIRIDNEINEFTFTMNEYRNQINNYKELKELLGL